jgi:uncharacterized protein
MFERKPFIYLFMTSGGFYFYDVNTSQIIRTQRPVWQLLFKIMRGNFNPTECSSEEQDALQIMRSMMDEGLLSSKQIAEIVHPYNEYLPSILKNTLNTVTLQVTQQCNFRCEYCIYSGDYENRGHAERTMSFETAKKSIDFVLSSSKDSHAFHVGFYGGEPLL